MTDQQLLQNVNDCLKHLVNAMCAPTASVIKIVIDDHAYTFYDNAQFMQSIEYALLDLKADIEP